MLRELWDPQGRRFGTRDARADRRTPEDTILAFTPLLDPALPRPMVGAIVELLGSPCFHPAEAVEHYLVPTYDLRAPGVRPPPLLARAVWINTDWLLWLGLRQHGVDDLAAEIRASMLGLVRRSGFREYFHPFAAQGYGASGFAWTAALVIDVLHRDRTRSDRPLATAR
jgi:Mannosylglycerate hydrolase MGH1-like glycoside hydrolase domain